MLIKIIICTVNDESKENFSHAQSQWKDLKFARGFIAQVGGWNLVNPNEAVIVGFWKSMEDYKKFMADLHDRIMDSNEQGKSYEKIEVGLWTTEEVLSGDEVARFGFLALIDVEDDGVDVEGFIGKDSVVMQIESDGVRKILVLGSTIEGVLEGCRARVPFDKEWIV
ncbi:YdbC family protein [Paenibacillus sp. N1-5-1-14]|uniref:YdbC family protein n=1 Tax=Paenibacillus radicibacter TaxID=2972488 RepID=UPI0021597F88|nr:YdbC family protein [Paenibacillus radicibacter]MCR8641282.1 YdbC family protein [Paenibacillus radicibacter]